MKVNATKWQIREKVWKELEEKEVAMFPLPPRNRIPNFVGADKAAKRLSQLEIWQKARILKVNPDSPQRFVRELALQEKKTIYMAVPFGGEINYSRISIYKKFLELPFQHIFYLNFNSFLGEIAKEKKKRKKGLKENVRKC